MQVKLSIFFHLSRCFWYILILGLLKSTLVYADSLNNSSATVKVKMPAIESIVTLNKIVAFVNKGVVTQHQVDVGVLQVIQNFKQKGMPALNPADIESRVVEQLIMQKIQLDLAARSGIKTSDIEISDAINNVAKAQNMDLATFKENLTKQGISFDDFRQQIQTQILLEKLKQREVDARVSVSDDEVNRVLNSEAYKNKIDYNLSDIIINLPEQATAEVVDARHNLANQVYAQLQSGSSFSQVAVKYSNGPNALTGGELGWKSSATLPPVIATDLAELKPGDYTSVIQLPMGFFIFKLNDIKKHGALQIVHQYKVRHILIKVNENNSDDEAHQKILDIENLLAKDRNNPTQLNLDFIKYAKEYSEDTSSINGGDIGWVSTGDTVPAFEKVVISTPVGVVSEPVRSPFGWHILEVVATRDSNLTNDKEKADIRQELHENKAALLYTQWLRDIRDAAYVEMNDD